MLPDFEKLGAFYLGRTYDMQAGRTNDDLLLYDSKDLTTHAVCVGMTGSGKTGLCLSLLEEAAIDGVPAIAIDPKGDLGNLLLTFPELKPADFRPWIDPADAARKGVTEDQLAEKTAADWKQGLEQWGEDGERIKRLRDAADFAIYTPGSNAGLPLTVLRSFAAPSKAVLDNEEAMRDRVVAAAGGLLSLLGIDTDPLRSREHILVSSILDRAWREGRDLDTAALIREIQSPPFDKVGVMDVESFFPAKDRYELAMSLNSLLASPGFAAWMQGESLDVQRLLYSPEGKPRIAILSIAHLSDAERMFFVTILLNELLSWMRSQSGTSSLRALLYMDEVFGYFPPTANPPSKLPMLTLLKQARAFGLGVVLATQNPVDLDYKGLSNAGTWFLGRLQTERDKARVLDGLEGASAAAGAKFDRQEIERTLSALGNRVFLMNNVHEDAPVLFQTRWLLSYLRGPLTRDQIRTLMQNRRPASVGGETKSVAKPASIAAGTEAARPMLPPEIEECFIARRGNPSSNSRVAYVPYLLAEARVHFAQAAAGVDEWVERTLFQPVTSGDVEWDETATLDEPPADFDDAAESSTPFAALPSELTREKTFKALATKLKDALYRNQTLSIWKCAALKAVSQPGESEGDFRARLKHQANERRDADVEKLRQKYAPKLATLEERKRRALQRVEKEKSEASQHVLQSAISLGTTVIGAIFGRKLGSATNVGRMATTANKTSRAMQQRGDVANAEENVEAVDAQIAQLDAQLKAEIAHTQGSMEEAALALDAVELKPKKADIAVTKVRLAWVPSEIKADGSAQPLI